VEGTVSTATQLFVLLSCRIKYHCLVASLVLDCKVGVAEDVKYPIAFLVVYFFPNGYSLDMLWEIVVCSSFECERFESSYASGLCESPFSFIFSHIGYSVDLT
jgi:hypothetical protein